MGPTQKILIVDDSATLRSIVRVYLAGLNLGFLEADSAERALEMAERERVDLIVLDQQLPGMDGVALAAHMRSRALSEHLKTVPIVMLTNDPSLGLVADATAAGVTEFLRKPVTQSGLADVVGRLLRRA